jgi:hypothetical protein
MLIKLNKIILICDEKTIRCFQAPSFSWLKAQLDSVVPVVYGGANYSRIAPPHSYIDARQFEPKQLANYLKKLDANDTLF